MKNIAMSVMWFVFFICTTAIADTEKAFPTTPPEQAAEEAFNAGNREYLRAAICVVGAPLDRGTKKVLEPSRVLVNCKEFTSEWKSTPAAKWEDYARRYNNTMYKLRDVETRSKSKWMNFPN